VIGRRRVPVVLQMEAVECGAASLTMILAHYGKYVALEAVRTMCGVTRDGASAMNIVRAARHYGLEARGRRMEPDDVRALHRPAILHWGLNHFVVYVGTSGSRVRINDPATGPRLVDADELDERFSGVVLLMEPGPDFVPEGRPASALRGLAARMVPGRRGLLLLLLTGLVLVAPGIVMSMLVSTFVSVVLGQGLTAAAPGIIAAMLVMTLISVCLVALQQSVFTPTTGLIAATMAVRSVENLLRLPMAFFTQRSVGDLAWRAGLTEQIAGVITGPVAQSVLSVVTASIYLVAMAAFTWELTLVVLLVVAVQAVTVRIAGRTVARTSGQVNRAMSELTGVSAGSLMMIESLKAAGSESDAATTWGATKAKVVTSTQASERIGIISGSLPSAISAIGQITVLAVGALLIMAGQLSIGTFAGFQILMIGFLAPVGAVLASGTTIRSLTGAVERLDDIDRAAGSLPTDPEGDGPVEVRGELELRDVTFGYDPLGPPLISEFSLRIGPGQRVAVVGPSGSGKSTLGRMACGLYAPWTGEVRIDGQLLSEWPPAAVTRAIAMVDQDVVLFEGTVRDNVTLWDDSMEDDVIIDALSSAAILDEVLARPGGLDAEVAEGGRNFSGGQRQRLEIARALALRTPIVVLDEATSALDPVTETRVDEALRARGVTALIVAHRLSTVRDSDLILVLDAGHVVESGTHEDLIEAGGAYARLVAA